MTRRLVAVLGYSDRSTAELHPVCRARLTRAQATVKPEDSVVLSGWARRGSSAPEAVLMSREWTAPARRLVLDRGARTTVGNVVGVARAARALAVDEVILVTSSWHGHRAETLLRIALRGSGRRVTLVSTEERSPRVARLRELACWAILPAVALAARAR